MPQILDFVNAVMKMCVLVRSALIITPWYNWSHREVNVSILPSCDSFGTLPMLQSQYQNVAWPYLLLSNHANMMKGYLRVILLYYGIMDKTNSVLYE